MEEISQDLSIKGQFEIILSILNIEEASFIDNQYYINSISYEQINRIIEVVPFIYNFSEEGYIDNKDLIDFVNKNKQFVLEGLILSPENNNCNMYLKGMKAPNTEDNLQLIQSFMEKYISKPLNIIESEIKEGFIRIYWN